MASAAMAATAASAAGATTAGVVAAGAAGAIGSQMAKDSAEDASQARLRGLKSAERAKMRMQDRQLEFLREGREQARSDLQPFREAGVSALQQYRNLLEDPSAMADDPGLQFLQQQGQRQVESSASARGMQLSGRTLGDLQERGTNIASQYRGQILGEIGQLINVGQSSAAQQASTAFQGGGAAADVTGQTGNTLAELAVGRGSTRAAEEIGVGRANAGTLRSLAFMGGNLFGGQTSGALAADPYPGQPGR